MFEFLQLAWDSLTWVIIIACALFALIGLISHIITQRIDKKFEKSLRWWSSSCGKIEMRMPIDLAEKAYYLGSRDAGMDKCIGFVIGMSQRQDIRDFTSAWNPDIVANILRENWFWSEEEIKNRELNTYQLLWVICSELVEQEEEMQERFL